jgi:hypothetical protein
MGYLEKRLDYLTKKPEIISGFLVLFIFIIQLTMDKLIDLY